MPPRTLAPFLTEAARSLPVVTLSGPRQAGNTTLVRTVFPDLPYITLEAPDIRERALLDPRGFLAGLSRGAVIDEVQRAPDLPPYIQGIVDEDPRPGRSLHDALHAGFYPRIHDRDLDPGSWLADYRAT